MLRTFLTLLLGTALIGLIAVPLHAAYASHGGPHGGATQPPGGGVQPPGGSFQQAPANPSTYLSNLYIYFLAFVGISALFAITLGGVLYIFAGANIGEVEKAKSWITNAIWGIILAALSYLLLFTINPDLVAGFNINALIP